MAYTSHDQLLKDLLRAGIEPFFQLFYPDMARCINFSMIEFLDKETFTDIPRGRRRESDLVVKTHTLEGVPQYFLFLIEVEHRKGQRRRADPIQVRLFQYYCGLWSRYRLPVLPIVLYLSRTTDGIQLLSYTHSVLEQTYLEMRYWSIGLPGLNAEQWLNRAPGNRGGALAGALASFMSASQWSRARHKLECVNQIALSAASQSLKFLALNCVQTYLTLNPEEEQVYSALSTREEFMGARKIFKTWADEVFEQGIEKGIEQGIEKGIEQGIEKGIEQGIEKGIEQGIEKGIEQGIEQGIEKGIEQGIEKGRIQERQRLVLKLLQLKFGPLEPEVVAQVQTLEQPEALDHLVEGILSATHLKQLGLG